jgi:hypothetical protein
MAAQIFQLRALPGATVTLSIDIQPNISSLEASEISEPTESRSRIICHKRTTTTCNSLTDKNAFKGKGFRLAEVVSRESKTSGEVHIARDFINRADGRRNTVLFMHAEKQGVKGTCKQEKRELVAIKFSRGEDATSSAASVKGDNAVLKHENAVLQFLKGKEIPHVIQPFQEGIFPIPESKRLLLIMKHANCGQEDRNLLPNVCLQDVTSMMLSLAVGLRDAHENGVTHGNINIGTVFFNTIEKHAILGHWKHGRFAENGPPECLPSPSQFLVVEGGILTIAEVRTAEDRYRKDSSDLAIVCMGLVSRNAIHIDFSGDDYVGKDIDQILENVFDKFNKFVSDGNLLLGQRHPVADVIKGLLSGEKDLTEIAALLMESQQPEHEFEGPVLIPAKYLPQEREMVFPINLASVSDTDEKGNQSIGIGAFAAVDTPAKVLVAKYLSHQVPQAYAERLRLIGKGCHLMSAGKGRRSIFNGARKDNGIFDVSFMVENVEVLFILFLCDEFLLFHNNPYASEMMFCCLQAASLINGSYNVKVEHGKSRQERQISVSKFTPNCEFIYKTWQATHLSTYPGHIVETDVVLVRSLRPIKKGEELYIDYGDGTAREFFGVDRFLSAGVFPADSEMKEVERPNRRRRLDTGGH